MYIKKCVQNIDGKNKNIYNIEGSRKKYIKYNNKYIDIHTYRKVLKKKRGQIGGKPHCSINFPATDFLKDFNSQETITDPASFDNLSEITKRYINILRVQGDKDVSLWLGNEKYKSYIEKIKKVLNELVDTIEGNERDEVFDEVKKTEAMMTKFTGIPENDENIQRIRNIFTKVKEAEETEEASSKYTDSAKETEETEETTVVSSHTPSVPVLDNAFKKWFLNKRSAAQARYAVNVATKQVPHLPEEAKTAAEAYKNFISKVVTKDPSYKILLGKAITDAGLLVSTANSKKADAASNAALLVNLITKEPYLQIFKGEEKEQVNQLLLNAKKPLEAELQGAATKSSKSLSRPIPTNVKFWEITEEEHKNDVGIFTNNQTKIQESKCTTPGSLDGIPYIADIHDIESIKVTNLLTNLIIDIYLDYEHKKSNNSNYIILKSDLYFEMFVKPNTEPERSIGERLNIYLQNLKKLTTKQLNNIKIIIPINLSDSHWIFGMIVPASSTIYILNPYGSQNETVFNNLQIVWNASFQRKEKTFTPIYNQVDLPLQPRIDSTSCGVFVLMYISYLLKNNSFPTTKDFTDVNIPQIRKFIFHIIINEICNFTAVVNQDTIKTPVKTEKATTATLKVAEHTRNVPPSRPYHPETTDFKRRVAATKGTTESSPPAAPRKTSASSPAAEARVAAERYTETKTVNEAKATVVDVPPPDSDIFKRNQKNMTDEMALVVSSTTGSKQPTTSNRQIYSQKDGRKKKRTQEEVPPPPPKETQAYRENMIEKAEKDLQRAKDFQAHEQTRQNRHTVEQFDTKRTKKAAKAAKAAKQPLQANRDAEEPTSSSQVAPPTQQPQPAAESQRATIASSESSSAQPPAQTAAQAARVSKGDMVSTLPPISVQKPGNFTMDAVKLSQDLEKIRQDQIQTEKDEEIKKQKAQNRRLKKLEREREIQKTEIEAQRQRQEEAQAEERQEAEESLREVHKQRQRAVESQKKVPTTGDDFDGADNVSHPYDKSSGGKKKSRTSKQQSAKPVKRGHNSERRQSAGGSITYGMKRLNDICKNNRLMTSRRSGEKLTVKEMKDKLKKRGLI